MSSRFKPLCGHQRRQAPWRRQLRSSVSNSATEGMGTDPTPHERIAPAWYTPLDWHPPIQTFLIADVRGYTRFTLEQGDEAAARLASRFAYLMRLIVTPLGGHVLELRGDEALACFASARNALRAAAHLQQQFALATAEDSRLPLPVGIGIDVGEAVPVEGGFRGAALNLAARLCSLAGPGEILTSEAVIHLARKVEGLCYQSWGRAVLKGFPEPVSVMAVQTDNTELPLVNTQHQERVFLLNSCASRSGSPSM